MLYIINILSTFVENNQHLNEAKKATTFSEVPESDGTGW